VTPTPLERALVEAARLFRARRFYEVHEVLEDVWRTLAGDRRLFVQGLIQIAVGFHHLHRGKPKSAAALFARGRAKLVAREAADCGVDVAALLADLEPWQAAAAAGDAWDDRRPLPRFALRLSDGGRFDV
jgi:predicted metal-dependent hydrolase